MKFLFVILISLLLANKGIAANTAEAEDKWSYPQPQKLFAMSDLHADADAFVALLLEMGLIDDKGVWVAENSHLVINGDILGRGRGSRFIYDFILKLQEEALKKSSRITLILGNHEIFTLSGQLEYAAKEDMAKYADWLPVENIRSLYKKYSRHSHTSDEVFRRRDFLEDWHKTAYQRAFVDPASPYAQLMRQSKAFVKIGDTIFVHAGLEAWTLDKDYVNSLNRVLANLVAELQRYQYDPEAQRSSDKHSLDAVISHRVFASDGPLRTRAMAKERSSPLSQSEVTQIISALGAKRVVIGHTPTPMRDVLVDYNGQVIRIDTAMSKGFKEKHGPIMGVEILASGQARAVHASRPQGVHPLRAQLEKQFGQGRPRLRTLEELDEALQHPVKAFFSGVARACARVFLGKR